MKESATSTVQASGLFHRMFGVGVHAGNSLPVRKLMVAVLLLVVATFLGVFAVAQAQAADGTMTGVTLASDSPGTLTVSWKAPTPAPTDYRLRWAPVGSDYLPWNGTNETDRGNAYPAGDVTSLTLSGLSEGTEFNVQARARYHKGEHKDSPWSGPWAEASALVMSESPDVPSAPAAPNLAGTVLTPEGHVMLLWQNPSDDSITGYQVLRGPDADSLVVIEQDTGSGGTSYTDTAPPTGQTRTYAVKARNAAGLSPLSNTVTATVPAAAPIIVWTVLTPEGQVMLLWQNPSDDSITGYQVLRGPDADSLVVIEEDTESSATSYTDTAPPAGQTHTYAVKARNAAGLSQISNTVTATVPPAAPNLVETAVTPAGQVLLLWQNPSDDSITGYQVLRGPDADSLVVIEEDTESSATSYTDTAPPAGQTHTYAVKARNAAGLSQISNGHGDRASGGAQPRGNRGDPRGAGIAVVAEPGERLDHRLPGPAGPGRRLPCGHRAGYGLERDQLHRHVAARGPDPHLRREGAQRRGPQPPVQHGHGVRAGVRRGRRVDYGKA